MAALLTAAVLLPQLSFADGETTTDPAPADPVEALIAQLDVSIEAAAADYVELTRLLGEKEQAEEVLMDLMQQWEDAQEG